MHAVDNLGAGSGSARKSLPLDYGRSTRLSDATRSVRAEFRERIHGNLHFFGVILGMAGGARQVLWAVGLASVFGGLGDCLASHSTLGPGWMALGGFLIGVAYRVPDARKSTQRSDLLRDKVVDRHH